MNHFQVLVIGSGFAGSIVALVLKQLGYSVVVVDRTPHPRFAIGESSTPIADRILEALAADYKLPELLPLSSYGEARKYSNQFTVGPKRGFSYFFHAPDQPFESFPPILSSWLFHVPR